MREPQLLRAARKIIFLPPTHESLPSFHVQGELFPSFLDHLARSGIKVLPTTERSQTAVMRLGQPSRLETIPNPTTRTSNFFSLLEGMIDWPMAKNSAMNNKGAVHNHSSVSPSPPVTGSKQTQAKIVFGGIVAD